MLNVDKPETDKHALGTKNIDLKDLPMQNKYAQLPDGVLPNYEVEAYLITEKNVTYYKDASEIFNLDVSLHPDSSVFIKGYKDGSSVVLHFNQENILGGFRLDSNSVPNLIQNSTQNVASRSTNTVSDFILEKPILKRPNKVKSEIKKAKRKSSANLPWPFVPKGGR